MQLHYVMIVWCVDVCQLLATYSLFMQQLFNCDPFPQRGTTESPSWNYTRRGLTSNLITVVNYYHNRSLAVRTNHLLVQLLNAARLNYENHLELFYARADGLTNLLANAFKLTSNTSVGKAFDGVFYGAGSTEVIIAHNESFDVHYAHDHWRVLSPVRSLMHSKTDIEMHIPNGVAYSKEQGVAVIAINIPMLFVMYRGFVLEQLDALRKGRQAKTTAQFIHTYVLSNMIGSHLDVALTNRLIATACGEPVVTNTSRKHLFNLSNWQSQTDKVIREQAAVMLKQSLSMHDMLCMMPAVHYINAAQAMRLPSMPPVYQYTWAEMLARIKVIAGLIFISPTNLLAYDKSHLQRIARTIDYQGPLVQLKKVLGNKAEETIELADVIVEVSRRS